MRVMKRKKKYQMRLGGGQELGFYESKHCEFLDGKLSAGVGIEPLKEFESEQIFEFLNENQTESVWVGGQKVDGEYEPVCFVVNENGRLTLLGGKYGEVLSHCGVYFAGGATLTAVYEESEPLLVAAQAKMGIYTVKRSGASMLTYAGDTGKVSAFLHGRLYFGCDYELFFTPPFQFLQESRDGDNAGKIVVDRTLGKIVSFLPYGEKLFVLQEYGGFFLEGGGSSRGFAVKKVQRLGGRAVGGCVAVGDEIVYLCEDGLYKRTAHGDGVLLTDRVSGIDFSKSLVATAVESGYRLAFTDENGARRARIFSLSNGSFYESLPLQAECGAGVTYGVLDGKIVKLVRGGELPETEERRALSYPTDFGTSKEKTLRKVSLFGRCVAKVTVRSERGFKCFSLDLIKGGEAEFALKGKVFEVEIVLGANTVLEEMEVEFDEVGGTEGGN
jgi:hypothetical protein